MNTFLNDIDKRHLVLWCRLNLVLDMLVNVSVTHPATRKKMAKFLFSWVKWCSGKYCYICSAYISVKIHGCSVFRLFTCPQWCQTSDVYSVPIIILTLLQRITPCKTMEDTVLCVGDWTWFCFRIIVIIPKLCCVTWYFFIHSCLDIDCYILFS